MGALRLQKLLAVLNPAPSSPAVHAADDKAYIHPIGVIGVIGIIPGFVEPRPPGIRY